MVTVILNNDERLFYESHPQKLREMLTKVLKAFEAEEWDVEDNEYHYIRV